MIWTPIWTWLTIPWPALLCLLRYCGTKPWLRLLTTLLLPSPGSIFLAKQPAYAALWCHVPVFISRNSHGTTEDYILAVLIPKYYDAAKKQTQKWELGITPSSPAEMHGLGQSNIFSVIFSVCFIMILVRTTTAFTPEFCTYCPSIFKNINENNP